MLTNVGVENPQQWLGEMYESAQDSVGWLAMVQGFTFPDPSTKVAERTRPYLSRSAKEKQVVGRSI